MTGTFTKPLRNWDLLIVFLMDMNIDLKFSNKMQVLIQRCPWLNENWKETMQFILWISSGSNRAIFNEHSFVMGNLGEKKRGWPQTC